MQMINLLLSAYRSGALSFIYANRHYADSNPGHSLEQVLNVASSAPWVFYSSVFL